MERNIKCKPDHLCIAVFTLCLSVRFVEYFLIKTDQTNGEMSFAATLLMGIGYMILAGIMGIKWGLLYRITGNLWAGLGDHLFNNTVATNMLHVVSLKGADELQIVRIMAAQIISFVFVLVIHTDRTTKVR